MKKNQFKISLKHEDQ